MPTPDRFVRLPKAELHVHLDGSLRPATLLELAGAAGVALPAADPAGIRSAFRADSARDLEDYLRRFALTVAVLQTPDALERVAREMVEDAAADGVRCLEVRYCPLLSCTGGLTLDEVIEAVCRGLRHGASLHDLPVAMICCTLRHFDPSQSSAIAEAAVRGRAAFEIAGRGLLRLTAHAGEASGPASIREALVDCRAERIGHGTRLFEDPELLAYVRDRQIPVEINLTSNVQTHAVPSLERHPLRQYLEAGLCVTLASDNWLISGVTLSSEYARAAATFSLSRGEITQLVLNGFRSSFLPSRVREECLDAARMVLDAW
jgi:adenosine deaminase